MRTETRRLPKLRNRGGDLTCICECIQDIKVRSRTHWTTSKCRSLRDARHAPVQACPLIDGRASSRSVELQNNCVSFLSTGKGAPSVAPCCTHLPLTRPESNLASAVRRLGHALGGRGDLRGTAADSCWWNLQAANGTRFRVMSKSISARASAVSCEWQSLALVAVAARRSKLYSTRAIAKRNHAGTKRPTTVCCSLRVNFTPRPLGRGGTGALRLATRQVRRDGDLHQGPPQRCAAAASQVQLLLGAQLRTALGWAAAAARVQCQYLVQSRSCLDQSPV